MPPEDTSPYDTSYEDSADTSETSGSSSSSSSLPSSNAASSASSASDTPLGMRRSDRGRSGSGGFSAAVGSGSSGVSASGAQADVNRLVKEGLRSLETQRRDLQREVEQLERRKARLEAEMKESFSGASQDIAIRVQGFKDYLVGSLQDLATAAEQINLVPSPMVEPAPVVSAPAVSEAPATDEIVPLAAGRFAQQRDRISSLLDQYRTRPDYYGPPWQLRRTFEPIHADRASNWFFNQAGRGAVKSMGSRLQNVLVASSITSCLFALYDRRLCVLVLATTPERLGEWRRWLQDCLGIARSDFGTNRGVMLFESAEPMAQRAERLLDSGRLPFLIMDEAEDKVSLSLLQYPMWLAFAPDPANPSAEYDYY
ncbi:MAG: DUF3086 domain-containing protein [Cyanobacteria bacterium J06607_10]